MFSFSHQHSQVKQEVLLYHKTFLQIYESFLHICKGTFSEGEGQVDCIVNDRHRNSVKKNHTATHLMHKALKEVLGDHVQQSGSLVADDRLRFDLTHYEKINQNQIQEIEKKVNNIIREN